MRKSSKILAVVFLLAAGGLVFWSTRRDATEIEAAVEARAAEATVERQRQIEEELAHDRERLEAEFAERQQALADTLTAREAAIEHRLAELDSAIAGVEHPVYFRLTADQVEGVLRRMGVAYERDVDDDGDPQFEFSLATYKTWLYFHGCEGNQGDGGCTSLRIYAGFSMNENPSVESINEWNRTKRYATAYLNSEGRPRLDTDLIIQGGVTLDAVEAFIVNFRDRLTEYTKHIDF